MGRKIFISYRREDSQWMAGRLYDKLLSHFSQKDLFIDIDSIDPGENFETYIDDQIKRCDVVLAIVGPKWLETIQTKTTTTDFVRSEISVALKNHIRVIPILLASATMPEAESLPPELQGFEKRNAFIINHTTFNSDIETLSRVIKKGFEQIDLNSTKKIKLFRSRKFFKKGVLLGSILLTFCVGLGWFYFIDTSNKSSPKQDFVSLCHVQSNIFLMTMDLTTGYGIMTGKNLEATIPVTSYTTFRVQDTGKNNFYYLLKKPETDLKFKMLQNKLYVNDKIRGLFIDERNNVPINLDTAEIRSLQTITISDSINESQISYIEKIIKINPDVSIVSDDENYNPNIRNLMAMTSPELLVCKTSFAALQSLKLGDVRCAFIVGDQPIDPTFYNSLLLPKLQVLIASKTETNKILLRNSPESITCIVDTTLTDLSVLRNRESIKQLQILDSKENNYVINFSDLSAFSSLKSFGYFNPNHSPNISPITKMISLNLHNVNVSDINQLAEHNPNLSQLSISFSDKLTNLNWILPFEKLESLSLKGLADSTELSELDISAIKRMKELKSLAIGFDSFEFDSKALEKLKHEYPNYSITSWFSSFSGACLGSGWLILVYPVLIIILINKKKFQKKKC